MNLKRCTNRFWDYPSLRKNNPRCTRRKDHTGHHRNNKHFGCKFEWWEEQE